MKTLGIIFAWLSIVIFVMAVLAHLAMNLFPRDPEPTDDELEKWRRAFEGTEYEWPRAKR